MKTTAKILLDSVAPNGARLTTFELYYPRFILPQLNTHRCFSRITKSNRLASLDDVVFVPSYWGKESSKMQAKEQLEGEARQEAMGAWITAAMYAWQCAKKLEGLGVHKQLVNRPLEPFSFTTTIVSSTDWDNFFNLRDNSSAQPEMQELAKLMHEKYNMSKPVSLKWGQWHTPLADKGMSIEDTIKDSVGKIARKASGSEGTDNNKLHDKLIKMGHLSPFEHVAMASQLRFDYSKSNFRNGWIQYRKMVEEGEWM